VPREQNRLFPGHGKERLGTGVSRALVARGHPFLAPAVRAMTQVPGSAGYTLSSPPMISLLSSSLCEGAQARPIFLDQFFSRNERGQYANPGSNPPDCGTRHSAGGSLGVRQNLPQTTSYPC
jgi:hypothetical protein